MRPRTGKPPFAIVDAPPVTPPAPPRTLGPAGQDLWSRVQAEYLVADCGGVELLTLACEASDRAQTLTRRIAQEGETLVTKTGLRAHPALRDELSNRAFIATTLGRLGITLEPVKPMGRPPGRHWRGYDAD